MAREAVRCRTPAPRSCVAGRRRSRPRRAARGGRTPAPRKVGVAAGRRRGAARPAVCAPPPRTRRARSAPPADRAAPRAAPARRPRAAAPPRGARGRDGGAARAAARADAGVQERRQLCVAARRQGAPRGVTLVARGGAAVADDQGGLRAGGAVRHRRQVRRRAHDAWHAAHGSAGGRAHRGARTAGTVRRRWQEQRPPLARRSSCAQRAPTASAPASAPPS
jgi:hypothetical protein